MADAEAGERNSALYRQAIAAEQTGDIDEAIRLYNKVLIEEPKSFSAHFQLATLLHDHREDYVGAIYHYNQYLYLRPESEKSSLAKERIRIAEQLLAPQILRKVGDSVQGITQAHLLKENDRLNRIITTLEGEKSVLTEARAKSDQELATLRSENLHLRGILTKMRVDDGAADNPGSLMKRVESAVRGGTGDEAAPTAKTDSKTLRALRSEAAALAGGAAAEPAPRKESSPAPSTEEVLKKVEARLKGADSEPVSKTEPAPAKEVSAPKAETDSKPAAEKADRTHSGLSRTSALALIGKGDRKAKESKTAGEPRTYVVQPGDTLFRVAEKFYGDSTQWRKIRDANRTRIDPDGRIRAGQIIAVP